MYLTSFLQNAFMFLLNFFLQLEINSKLTHYLYKKNSKQ